MNFGHFWGRRRRTWLSVSCMILVALAVLFVLNYFYGWFDRKPPPLRLIHEYPAGFSQKTILIDPGHGGDQDGAITGDSEAEKTINLRMAKALAEYLRSTGRYNVHLTRTTDRPLGINARWMRSNDLKADAFISLHADWSNNGRNSGGRVFWSSRQRDLPGSRWSIWLAHSVSAALKEIGCRRCTAGEDIRHTSSLKHRHAYVVTDRRTGAYVTDKRVLGVLRYNQRPAVLIETHYLSNSGEVKRYRQPETVDRFCRGVELGLLNFFARRDGIMQDPEIEEPGNWVIQIAATPKKSGAQRLLNQLKAKGFPAYLEHQDDKKKALYQVRVGPFEEEAELYINETSLKVKGYSDRWVVFLPDKTGD